MKKERIASFDFIRGISALLIVLYHSVGVYQLNPGWDNFPIKAENAAGNWSISIVAVFFMISGAALYYMMYGFVMADLPFARERAVNLVLSCFGIVLGFMLVEVLSRALWPHSASRNAGR